MDEALTADEITVTQAATLLDIDEPAIRWAIRRGHIAARRVGQRVYLVQRLSVLAYHQRRIERQRRKGARHAATN